MAQYKAKRDYRSVTAYKGASITFIVAKGEEVDIPADLIEWVQRDSGNGFTPVQATPLAKATKAAGDKAPAAAAADRQVSGKKASTRKAAGKKGKK